MADPRLILWFLLWSGWIAAPAALAQEAWWIDLPPASAPEILADYPASPMPNARALARRARLGRPDRIAIPPGPRASDLAWLEAQGLRLRQVSRWYSRVSVEGSPAALDAARRRFGSQSLSRVARLRRSPAPQPELSLSRGGDLPDYGPSAAQLQMSQVEELHALGLTGRGIRILVLDTGFLTSHPALDHLPVVAEWDFVNGDGMVANEASDVAGQHQHGTGVLAVLSGFAPGELIGPAYGAEVLLAKTEHVPTETISEEDNFIAALEWGEALGADLMSASLGYTTFSDDPGYAPEDRDGDTPRISRAVDDLVALGVSCVVSMGNDGNTPGNLSTPADADSVLSVGSLDLNGDVSAFSSRGPSADGRFKPDLSARGRAVRWALAGGGYGSASGTSLAAPIVAGVAALLMEAHPEWGPGELRDALRQSADQALTPDSNRGWGLALGHDALLELGAPLHPMPFCEVAPADSASGPESEFRWNEAFDYQGDLLRYLLHFSSQADFSDTLGLWSSGPDTSFASPSLPSNSFFWRVVAEDVAGNFRPTAGRFFTPTTPSGVAPAWAQLRLAGKNPGRAPLALRAELVRSATAELRIHDIAGRHLRTVRLGTLSPTLGSPHEFEWDGRDRAGQSVSSGVYLLELSLRDNFGQELIWNQRVVLLR